MPVVIIEPNSPTPGTVYPTDWMKCLQVKPREKTEDQGGRNHVCHERRNHEGDHVCNCNPPFRW